MVKPLAFKGEPLKHKSKKRKLEPESLSTALSTIDSSSSGAIIPPTEDDSWLTPSSPTDLTGPIVFVLPVQPPRFLATDTNGSVFAAAVENIIEGDARTAEPSDVRTVWVAGTIPGSSSGTTKRVKRGGVEDAGHHVEGDGDEGVELCFKSCYGNYLSVDGKGGLSAQGVAVGRAETFRVVKFGKEEEGFAVLTASSSTTSSSAEEDPTTAPTKQQGEGGYISASTTTTNSSSTTTTRISSSSPTPAKLIIRMQTRFHAPTVAALKASSGSSSAAAKEKISRSELEKQVGRKLTDEEVKMLKRAYRHGTLREEMLGLRVKKGRDKFA